ncbi:MAG: signal peptidase II [Coriobacteriia bacterium]|nr:signal peptidase II [Coriobacteriia bacterium]MCL2537043.1 signal peptidase II [Coriobacteriia bacterium]
MFQAVAIFWLLLDFVVKQLVTNSMELRESIAVWPNVFHLTYVRNYGAAFSMMQGQRELFFVAMALLVVMVIWFWMTERPKAWTVVVGTALVFAGALGNTLDRVISHSVIDMFDFRLINFAVFNVADIGITLGATLFLFWFLFQSKHIVWRELFSKEKPATTPAPAPAPTMSADASIATRSDEPSGQEPSPRGDTGEASSDESAETAPSRVDKRPLRERMSTQLKDWEKGLDDE